MPKSDPSTHYGAPPAYPYHPRRNGSDAPRTTQTLLPPMSSLLPEIEPAETHYPYSGPPFPSQQQEMNNALWLSESDVNAPVQHIYRPPHPPTDAHSVQYLTESIHVPIRAPVRPLPTQPRQVKRIVQRRGIDGLKGHTTPGMPPTPGRDQYTPYNTNQIGSPYQQRQGPMPSPAPSHGQRSRMPIANLLVDNPSPEPERRPPVKYTLSMRQEPQAARACGFGERDRRVVDPPPILEMKVSGEDLTPEDISALIRQPAAVVHCTLWDPVANKDDTAMPGTTDKRQQRRLMGTLVSSPFVGLDEHGVEGCFFTFPDLSVRTPGTYSLRFSLMILNPKDMRAGSKVGISSQAFSQSFHVFNAKDFGGMLPSTELTKRLKHQGCLISVKKGNAKASGGGKHAEDDDDLDDDEDEDDDLGNGGKGKKPAKRLKR